MRAYVKKSISLRKKPGTVSNALVKKTPTFHKNSDYQICEI